MPLVEVVCGGCLVQSRRCALRINREIVSWDVSYGSSEAFASH